jgi:hypothetical protein
MTLLGDEPLYQAEAFIHEMAHAQVGGAHISDRGYESDRVLRFLSTAEALTNAESFGLFVHQLGTGKVPPMPTPKDKRADCPKDWWDWIQFAAAREWSGGPAPTLTEVLGSTLWRSDRLRITVTPIEPKIPGQESFTENGSSPHQRISDRLPVYQTEQGQAAELPFKCSFDFFVDDANMSRPAPFTPPRLSASLHFRDASAKIQQIIGTTETRPVYQGAGRRLSSAGGFLEGIFNRNGQLAVKARLEDPDTHITRVYDDLIQIRADRSAEKTAVVPQVEGCTGWEKNPEGFVKYVATYVAIAIWPGQERAFSLPTFRTERSRRVHARTIRT